MTEPSWNEREYRSEEANQTPSHQPSGVSELKHCPESIISTYVITSAAAGALPIPLLDLAAVTMLQVKMVRELSDYYNQSLTDQIGATAVAAMVASLGITSAARRLVGSAVKLLPGLGHLVGLAISPVLAGASTYAIGTVINDFYLHGGITSQFKPEEHAAALKSAFEKHKQPEDETDKPEKWLG